MGCQGCLAHPSSQPEWGVGRSGGSITPSPPGDRGSLEGASQWGRHSGRTPVLRTPTLSTLLEGHLARLGAEPPQGDLAASPTVPKNNTNPRGGQGQTQQVPKGQTGREWGGCPGGTGGVGWALGEGTGLALLWQHSQAEDGTLSVGTGTPRVGMGTPMVGTGTLGVGTESPVWGR